MYAGGGLSPNQSFPFNPMVWGIARGVDDLVKKLQDDATEKTMLIMSTRSFGDTEAAIFCRALASNSSLEELLCSGHKISEIGARSFAQALKSNKKLKRISIGHEHFGDEAGEALFLDWSNSTLTHIDLEFNGLGEKTMDALSKALMKNNNIEVVVLGRNNINCQGLKYLSQGIVESESLCTLDISRNQIGIEGCRALNTALTIGRDKTYPLTLILDENTDIGASGIQVLTETDKSMKIKELSLKNCNIGDEGLVHLSRSVPFWDHLSVLRLSCNSISDVGVSNIAAIIKKNNMIEILDLATNSIGNAGFKLLAECVKTFDVGCCSLRSLDLSRNEITDQVSSKSLIDIVHAECLSKLHLLGNPLGNKGTIALFQALVGQHSIQVLGLGGVGFTDESCEKALELINCNTGLQTIELGSNNLGERGRELITAFRVDNPHIDIAIDKNPGSNDEKTFDAVSKAALNK